MELFHREFGSGPPLVVLHGLLGSGANWHSLAKGVLSQTHRTLVVDLPNHGKSPRCPDMTYAGMARALAGFLDRNEIDRAGLLGHSMGGKVAMQFSLSFPERARELVVVDIAPRAYLDGHTHLFRAMRAHDVSSFARREELEAALADDVPEPRVRRFLLKNLSRVNGRYEWSVNLGAVEGAYTELMSEIDARQPFQGPVLVLRGARSDYVRDSDWLDIVRLFPAAELVTIPGAGHWVHTDAPGAVGTAVASFLNY